MCVGWYSVLLAGLVRLVAGQEYDYVVVGSGPGGGTVAVDLAKAGFSTLLIEAGPDHSSEITSIPAMHFSSSEDPNTSLDFTVHHYDKDDGGYFYPRAAALGGCSVHNAMITLYPNTRDFQEMVNITGDRGWSEESMRKYLRRIEANQYVPRTAESEKIHGFDGWIPTSITNLTRLGPPDLNMEKVVLKEYGDLKKDGNGYFHDKLSVDTDGTIFLPLAIDKETYKRFDLGGYIKKHAAKGKLDIWTDTFVTKILFDKDLKAHGVEYSSGKYLYGASPRSSEKTRSAAKKGQVLVRKEVIVSGGSFNTPQLLMLSGIGNKTKLEELGIPVVKDLPGVGHNMMDRYEVPHVIKYPNTFHILKDCHYETKKTDACYEQYIKNKTGPYIGNGVLSAELISTRPELPEPDLLMLNVFAEFHSYHHNYSKELDNERGAFTRLACLGHTMNNGYVELRSTDPFQPPFINFRYFSHDPDNLDTLVKIVKDQRTHFKSFPGEFTELYPGKDVQTDAEIRAYVKKLAWGHHACCTAKLGKNSDPMAVLDAKFRVRGVKNLRVVDASSLPVLPGYFPSLFLHMVASRAAELIIEDASP
ncbi:hypothetical protein DSO57_1031804 [Entomophthora muscae]|uniref:Uncharacterized protein n=1 Tax=Entomophthora muscae TaxID=34485 RepID=A0ACC2SPS1_9FUNG|nr:hypothetical protein DSO57_1031804 [Entomophthora muscae]